MVPDDAFHEGARRRVRGLQLKNNNCRWWHEPRILFDSVHRSVNFHLSIVAKERERERRRRKREEKKLVAMRCDVQSKDYGACKIVSFH